MNILKIILTFFSLLFILFSLCFIHFLSVIQQRNQSIVIVVGSGLAGLNAAYSALEKGAFVYLIEKSEQIGATSGINGAETYFQKNKGIDDSKQNFLRDVFLSYFGLETPQELVEALNLKENANKLIDKLCENVILEKKDVNIENLEKKFGIKIEKKNLLLMETLVEKSSEAISFLNQTANVEFTDLFILGGHSGKRTHRTKAGTVGASLVKAVNETIVKEFADKIKVIMGRRVIQLLENKGKIIGVKMLGKNEEVETLYGNAVVLTSGGFGHDFVKKEKASQKISKTDLKIQMEKLEKSLLEKYAPEKLKLPTTNGEFAEGDGMKIAEDIGANLVDMTSIQIHPTGFISLQDFNKKTKILAPEALRGVGGIIINKQGKRFVNELTLRKSVVEAMQKKAKETFGPNLDFYLKIGLFKEVKNGEELSKELKFPLENLKNSFENYKKGSEKGEDEYKKTKFPVLFSSQEVLYYAYITPVLHYTMGGVEFLPNGQVLNKKNSKIIENLYAAGEVTGGLHGNNRLGGNSLLECVVFGKIAGESAANKAYLETREDTKVLIAEFYSKLAKFIK